jgi:hypothetical protein
MRTLLGPRIQQVLYLLFLVGIGACAVAVWTAFSGVSDVGIRIAPGTLAAVAGSLLVAWVCALESWRNVYRWFLGTSLAWRDAGRHLGLILVGKYLPGGVFGFAARVYDQADPVGPRGPHVVAGLYEQLQSVLVTGLLGGVCYAAAILQVPTLLLLAPLVAVMAWGLLRLAIRIASSDRSRLRALLSPPAGARPYTLLVASVFITASAAGWLLSAYLLADQLVALNWLESAGIAGAYGLAIVVGIAVVFLPGGIGAREGAFIVLASHWIPAPTAVVLAGMLRLAGVGMDMMAGLVALTFRPQPPAGAGES